jgi:hypothetical protein
MSAPIGISVVHERADEALAFGADVERATAKKARASVKTTSLAVNLLNTLVPILSPFLVTSELGPRHW